MLIRFSLHNRENDMTTISYTYCLLVSLFAFLTFDASALSNCTKAYDVAFLIDSGPDVENDQWNKDVRLCTRVVEKLHPSDYGTHMAVILFGGNATVVQGLEGSILPNYTWPRNVDKGRNLAEALRVAYLEIFTNNEGDRPNVPDVIVIVTHGLSDHRKAAVLEATKLKSEGILVIAIGVGFGKVDNLRRELRKIATNLNDVDNLFILNDLHYDAVESHLLLKVCLQDTTTEEGTLRLADEHSGSGKLEIFWKYEWVTVCSNSWSQLNSKVACKQLNFPTALTWYTVDQTTYIHRVGLASVVCSGNESRLLDCPHDPVFNVDSSACDRQRDVYLKCLCIECNDYRAGDNIRLDPKDSISGCPEVFSPERQWGGICSDNWTDATTKVLCLTFGFLDGAGTYQLQSVDMPVHLGVDCTGTERYLYDCNYITTSNAMCRSPVCIGCQCGSCTGCILRSPQFTEISVGSSVTLSWTFDRGKTETVEFWFLSRKNPLLLLTATDGITTIAHTDFRQRILFAYNQTSIGITITNVSRNDMGTYSLYIPQRKLFNSQAILFIRDFAVTPEPIIHRKVDESVIFIWDFTILRRIQDVEYNIVMMTPATGRISIPMYKEWLKLNSERYGIQQPLDQLRPLFSIYNTQKIDEGDYVIELTLTSSAHQWSNLSLKYISSLDLEDRPDADTVDAECIAYSFVILVLVVLLVVSTVLGVRLYRRSRRWEMRIIESINKVHRGRYQHDVTRHNAEDCLNYMILQGFDLPPIHPLSGAGYRYV